MDENKEIKQHSKKAVWLVVVIILAAIVLPVVIIGAGSGKSGQASVE